MMADLRDRYHDASAAVSPGDLPKIGKVSDHVVIAHGKLPDPLGIGNPAYRMRKQQVAINERHDALETELKAGRVTARAYLAAREYGNRLERARGVRNGRNPFEPGDRPDAGTAATHAIVAGIDNARVVQELILETRGILGMRGQRLLEQVLVGRLTFVALAEQEVGSAERKVLKRRASEIAAIFRDHCENLGAEWKGFGL